MATVGVKGLISSSLKTAAKLHVISALQWLPVTVYRGHPSTL